MTELQNVCVSVCPSVCVCIMWLKSWRHKRINISLFPVYFIVLVLSTLSLAKKHLLWNASTLFTDYKQMNATITETLLLKWHFSLWCMWLSYASTSTIGLLYFPSPTFLECIQDLFAKSIKKSFLQVVPPLSILFYF